MQVSGADKLAGEALGSARVTQNTERLQSFYSPFPQGSFMVPARDWKYNPSLAPFYRFNNLPTSFSNS